VGQQCGAPAAYNRSRLRFHNAEAQKEPSDRVIQHASTAMCVNQARATPQSTRLVGPAGFEPTTS
jgi:hypothetical protein